MKNKPDAYALEFSGKPSDIVKCENCGFKCVLCQMTETGKCPKCGISTDNIKDGKVKKK